MLAIEISKIFFMISALIKGNLQILFTSYRVNGNLYNNKLQGTYHI